MKEFKSANALLAEAMAAAVAYRQKENPQRYQLWMIALAAEIDRLSEHCEALERELEQYLEDEYDKAG